MSFISNLITKCQALKARNRERYSCTDNTASNSSDLVGQEESVFVNLAPTNEADEKGTYCRALEFATSDSKVLNIALTGPYGSGKSSIIQTFLTKYKGSELQISLAAFIPEERLADQSNESGSDSQKAPTKFDKKVIERSILQQMLYGADANKLPLSRFNRIQSPTKWAPAISLLGLLGVFATAYLLSKTGKLFNGELLTPFEKAKWFDYLMLAFSGSFLWVLGHKIYLQTFGVSLKSVSLKNIELASSVTDEASILNKHLDEIIYFFQSTNYDLVIFEDLDRFNDPSIFVTLREINSLVNANVGVKRKIRFLYALRDDIFVNTERTKFFEFIIPVMPVINHSNSIDKVLELTKRQALTTKLDNQFLSEVSRYLNDMRLIKSIFNEFAIYSASLADENGNIHDPNKLLAILIYKNVLPRDFEALHQQQGILAEILVEYDQCVLQAENTYKDQIRAYERKINDSNEQLPNSIKELTNIYAMALIELAPQGYDFFRFNNQIITFKDLSTHKDFEKILTSNNFFATNYQSNQLIDTSHLQNAYTDRKTKIELKTENEQEVIYSKIRKLKKKLVAQRFHEVIQANEDQITTMLLKSGKNAPLLKYLIFEGYLDDTYYQYISFFHEGRMSPKDNEFLINIRAYKLPSPEFKIDNPDEVIKSMRDEDFARNYILNHTLIDFLIGNSARFSKQLESALKYISENFSECDDFFSGYYVNGKQTDNFVRLLAEKWPDFAVTALDSSSNADHIARILVNVPIKTINDSLNNNEAITDFLSTSGERVFDQELSFDLDKLTALEIKIIRLSSISKHVKLVEHFIKNNLYAITPDNIGFIVSEGTTAQSEQLSTCNLTTILQSKNKPLISYIENNYETYFDNVFFSIETNTHEDIGTLQVILSNGDIETERKEQVLASQHTVFQSFDGVPTEFYTDLLIHKTIVPSWESMVCYLNSEVFDENVLTQYLKDLEIQSRLTLSKLPAEDEAIELHRFILNKDDFEDEEYQTYIELFSRTFQSFPKKISNEKILILINARKVTLNEDSFAFLDDSNDLLAALLITKIDEYMANNEKYMISDSIRERLISSNISNAYKFKILSDLDVNSVVESSNLAASIAKVLVVTDFNPENFGFDYLEAVIGNAETTEAKIVLLNKCYSHWEKEQVISIIECLPEPFSNIAKLSLAPKIPKTLENIIFSEWLDRHNFISSQAIKGNKIHIHNYKKVEVSDEVGTNTVDDL